MAEQHARDTIPYERVHDLRGGVDLAAAEGFEASKQYFHDAGLRLAGGGISPCASG
jgi:hypothetical protein